MTIPALPDSNTADFLQQNQQEARQYLKAGQDQTSADLKWAQSQGPRAPGPAAGAVEMQSGPAATAEPVQEGPSAGAEEVYAAPTPPEAEPAKPPAGQLAGLGSEVGNGLMRGFAGIARAIGLAGSVPAGIAAEMWTGNKDASDAYFKAMDKYIDSAYHYWTPENQDQHGATAKVAGNVAGMAAPLLLGPAGAVAMPVTSFTNSAMDSIQEGQGASTAVKIGLLNAAATAAGMKAPALFKNFGLWKRVLFSMDANIALDKTAETLTRKVLNDDGYKEAAARIDLADPASFAESGLMGAIFGALEKGGKPLKRNASSPAAAPPSDGSAPIQPLEPGEVPPPAVQPPPPVAGPSNTATTAIPTDAGGPAQGTLPAKGPMVGEIQPVQPPAPLEGGNAPAEQGSPQEVAKTPDQPTAEPFKDLRAQFADMKAKNTPRTGVFLSTDSLTALGGKKNGDGLSVANQLKEAEKAGRVVDTGNGKLIVKTPELAEIARQDLAGGVDPQKVIGRHVGSGEGKAPDATVAVQGKTADGAVAKESLVPPAEVPAKVAEVQAEGKIPEVKAPEQVLAEREQGLAAEQAELAIEPAKPVEPVAGQEINKSTPAKDSTPQNGGVSEAALTAHHAAQQELKAAQTAEAHDAAAKKVRETGVAAGRTPEAINADVVAVERPAPPKNPKAAAIKAKAAEHAAPETRAKVAAASEVSGELKPAEGAPAVHQHLADAANELRSQETPGAGEKAPTLEERAGNISSFSRVLHIAAEQLDGKVPDSVLARAVRAVTKTAGLDAKSSEAIRKGKGIGHLQLNVHRENLLNAARLLLDPEAKVPDEMKPTEVKTAVRVTKGEVAKPVESLEDRVKRRAADNRARSEKKAAEASKVKVIEDVPDETKPRELTPYEQQRLKQVVQDAVKAKVDDDHTAKMKEVDRLMTEMGMSDDDKSMVKAHILSERRDAAAKRPKSMDEEIEEDLGAHGVDYSDPNLDPESFLRDDRNAQALQDLHDRIRNEVIEPLNIHAPLGMKFSAKDIVDRMLKYATGDVRHVLQILRDNVPDGTVVRPVEQIMDSRTNEPSPQYGGQFVHDTNTVEIAMNKDLGNPRLTHTLIHEIWHAATAGKIREDLKNEMHNPLVAELKTLRAEAERRARRQFGDKYVNEHMAFWAGKGPKPEGYSAAHYGLHNELEFIAEAMTPGRFASWIRQSEAYRYGDGLKGLYQRFKDAIARYFGLGPADAALFNRVFDVTHDVAVENKKWSDAKAAAEKTKDDKMEGLDDLLGALRHVDDETPLRNEWRLRAAAGREAALAARVFRRALDSRVAYAARNAKIAFKTIDQIVRDHARDFGDAWHDSNPLRRFSEVEAQRQSAMNRMLERAQPIIRAREALSLAESRQLGDIQTEATRWGVDPDLKKDDQGATVQKAKWFDDKHAELRSQFNALSPEARDVYRAERDHYKWQAREIRKASVDSAVRALGGKLTDQQLQALYDARNPEAFDSLVGEGKLIDLKDDNDKLLKGLHDVAGVEHREGPYFAIQRHGEHVVEISPKGTKYFADKDSAEAYGRQVRALSPSSRAKVEEIGGRWQVEYKAHYVSMHDSYTEAKQRADDLRAQGHDVGQVTRRAESSRGAIGAGAEGLMAEAARRMRNAPGESAPALEALRSAYVHLTAQRSAYAASKLARQGFGGASGGDMARNFAANVRSAAYHVANMKTAFERANALADLRESAKSPGSNVPQDVVERRGRVVDELNQQMTRDVRNYGSDGYLPSMSRGMAKLGFLNFLGSVSHSAIWMTQNFTTGIPVAGARWGYGRSLGAFGRSMKAVSGPAVRAAVEAHLPEIWARSIAKDGNPARAAEDILHMVVKAVSKDPEMGKWAPKLKELIDRGAISHGFMNEIASVAHGAATSKVGRGIDRVYDYGRLMPHFADTWNRVSTGLAGLELTGGDVAKAADFVRETHMDYSQENKSRVFKTIGKTPVIGKSIVMFKTYTQGMAHLLGSNIHDIAFAESKDRGEAAKAVAGLMLGNALFTGVVGGAAIEPVRLMAYMWNKVFGDGEYHDFDNTVRRFMADVVGKGPLAEVLSSGLPRALNIDVSKRMGLSDLLLHDPPDLLGSNNDQLGLFLASQLGPMPEFFVQHGTAFRDALEAGRTFDAMMQLVPVKAAADMAKAFDLYGHGARNASGAQLTQPGSLSDAAVQAIGFKPGNVANAKEKVATISGHKQFVETQRQRLLTEWAKATDKNNAMGAIQRFNQRYPERAIKGADFASKGRGAVKTEMMLRGDTRAMKSKEEQALADY